MLTGHSIICASRCCSGRIVSALEGGYRIQGGPVSAFARSVAAHVRALAAASRHSQAWHPADSNVRPGTCALRSIHSGFSITHFASWTAACSQMLV
jgi:hypothetical protein